MPELKKERQERFANIFAACGEKDSMLTTAYKQAGYETNSNQTARIGATRLLKIDAVANRIRELRELIDQKVEERLPSSVDEAVKTRIGRISALSRDLAATEAIIAERAVYDEHADVPGGTTGHVVTGWTVKGNIKTIDEKGRTTITPDYVKTHSYDTKLVERRQSLLDQISQELGQKMDRKQQVPMTVDELKQLPVFEAFLESAFKDAEKAGLLDEPSPEDKEAVEDLLNGKV